MRSATGSGDWGEDIRGADVCDTGVGSAGNAVWANAAAARKTAGRQARIHRKGFLGNPVAPYYSLDVVSGKCGIPVKCYYLAGARSTRKGTGPLGYSADFSYTYWPDFRIEWEIL